jgi:hypothetical protein
MRPTLVFIRHSEINGRLFSHDSELPDDVLTQEQIDRMLDQKLLAEYPQRRSLYRLFAPFSGAKEREPLDAELVEYALPK